MKKINKKYLDFFGMNNLIKYLKIVNRYIIRNWQYVIILLLASCSVQNQINKDDYKRIPKRFSASFYDKLDSIKNQYDNRVYTKSFIRDFTNIDNIDYSKPIQIDIINKDLFLKFEDVDKKQYEIKFYGNQYNKKFVFYTNYETITFPILFIRKDMTKYSIYLPNSNEISIQKNNVSEGMLLFIGGGSSSESNYKFKLLKNE